MNTLSACISSVVTDGYKECFKVTARGLYSTSRSRYYRPEQVHVIASYRFDDNPEQPARAIIYTLETSDGLKGTLVDSYSTHCDEDVSRFIVQVEDIGRKMNGQSQHFC